MAGWVWKCNIAQSGTEDSRGPNQALPLLLSPNSWSLQLVLHLQWTSLDLTISKGSPTSAFLWFCALQGL